MPRLITVFIECKTGSVRQAFEEIFARKPGYIVTQANQADAADVFILELDDTNPQRTFSSIRSTVSVASQTEVFLTTARTDPQMMLEAFRLGVKEYIPQPVNPHEMESVLGRFEERLRARVPTRDRKAGRVVSIIGAKGGIGTSTVAINLAAASKEIVSSTSVALVDLNLQNSDLPLFLDVSTSGGLREVSQDLSRLDETILSSVLMKHKTGIDLLPSGYDGMDGMTPASGCVTHTLDLMQSLYDLVFIDCGHTLDTTKEALDFSSTIILVMTLNVPAVRRTKQLLDVFQDAHYGSNKIMLVVNRYSPRDEELLRHTEDTLKHKVDGLIPNDYGSTNRAMNDGQPLSTLAPRAAITQWFLKQGGIFGVDHREARLALATSKDDKKGSFLTRCLPVLGLSTKAKLQLP